jgi:hypothetical protein
MMQEKQDDGYYAKRTKRAEKFRNSARDSEPTKKREDHSSTKVHTNCFSMST